MEFPTASVAYVPIHHVELGKKKLRHIDSGEKRLLELGYKQELRRGLSFFTNFAFAFNVVSILAGITTTFAAGYGFGGPVVLVYGWLLVSLFSTAVALSMAEICSAYPTSGGLYVWAYQLAGKEHGPFWCWLTGWFNAVAQWAGTASIDIGMAEFLGTMIAVGMGPEYAPSRAATLLLFVGVLISHAIVNSFEVRVVGYFQDFSVAWHILGTLVFITVLPLVAKNHESAEFVFTNFEAYDGGNGVQNAVYRFLVGLLFAQFTLCGFDASAQMSEETQGSDSSAPWGMVSAVVVSSVVGLLFIFALLFSICNPHTLLDPGNETGGYAAAQIIYDAMHDKYRNKWSVLAMLNILAVAIWQCGLSSMASGSRMSFAFARGGALPMSSLWQTVLPKSKVPIYAVWFSALISFCFALPYAVSITAFTATVSITTLGNYISYGLPIALRITHAQQSFQEGPFSLGIFSFPCALMSILWVMLITVLFCLPVVFPVTLLNFNYAPVALGVTLFAALFSWSLYARNWFKGPVGSSDVAPLSMDDYVLM